MTFLAYMHYVLIMFFCGASIIFKITMALGAYKYNDTNDYITDLQMYSFLLVVNLPFQRFASHIPEYKYGT